jgi:hypothetical protein
VVVEQAYDRRAGGRGVVLGDGELERAVVLDACDLHPRA